MKKVLVIVGPTASGKSDLAVQLAKKFDGEIISADSRQVYKGLNIGTGKITKGEMLGIPHHLLDVANPCKQFSVAEYKKLALEKIEKIISRGNMPIVVGGTGFYVDTLTNNLDLPEVPPNQKLRSHLNKLSVEKLFEMLKTKDPNRAKQIDPHNKVRLIRALEIIEKLGKVPKITKKKKQNLIFIYIGLRPEKEKLNKRIYTRLIRRLPGMIREVRNLHAKGLPFRRMYELGLEYRYLSLYLQNKIDKQEMIDKLYREIKNYARRQMTWFKRNKETMWFTPNKYKTIEKYLSGR